MMLFYLKCVLIGLVSCFNVSASIDVGWCCVIFKHAVTQLWTKTIVGPWPDIPQIVSEQEMDLNRFGQQLR